MPIEIAYIKLLEFALLKCLYKISPKMPIYFFENAYKFPFFLNTTTKHAHNFRCAFKYLFCFFIIGCLGFWPRFLSIWITIAIYHVHLVEPRSRESVKLLTINKLYENGPKTIYRNELKMLKMQVRPVFSISNQLKWA